jgi:hypothetical protein
VHTLPIASGAAFFVDFKIADRKNVKIPKVLNKRRELILTQDNFFTHKKQ